MKKYKKKKLLGAVGRTERGFEVIYFRDEYDNPCSLQASSPAIYEKPGTSAVWLGCDDAQPRIMASDAARLGIFIEQKTGWIPYEIPREVFLTTHMHLNRKQVKALIAHLKAWLSNGKFELQND